MLTEPEKRLLRDLLTEQAQKLRLELRELEASEDLSEDYALIQEKLLVMEIVFVKLCREWP